MKPISFLLTNWRRKDTKTTIPGIPSPPEQASAEVISASTLPTVSFDERGSVFSI